MSQDSVCRFLFDDLDILCAVVSLGAVWRKMLENRAYPEPVVRLPRGNECDDAPPRRQPENSLGD
jgi:hypothetical protein